MNILYELEKSKAHQDGPSLIKKSNTHVITSTFFASYDHDPAGSTGDLGQDRQTAPVTTLLQFFSFSASLILDISNLSG